MKMSKLEKVGYAALDELGISYEPQHLIGGKFCVDAFVPSLRLIVQFDGDYWHGNPQKFPVLDKRQARRKHMDQSQDAYLGVCGFTVLRFWESDVYRNPALIRDQVLAHAAALGQTPAVQQ